MVLWKKLLLVLLLTTVFRGAKLRNHSLNYGHRSGPSGTNPSGRICAKGGDAVHSPDDENRRIPAGRRCHLYAWPAGRPRFRKSYRYLQILRDTVSMPLPLVPHLPSELHWSAR
jgi:hypothetical protein